MQSQSEILESEANTVERLPVYVFLLSLLFAIYYTLNILPFHLDDAYITHRYAQNLVAGFGFVFNPQGEVVEGFSSPLWLLFLAGSGKIFGSQYILVTSVLTGLTAYFLTVWRIAVFALNNNDNRWALSSGVLAVLLPSYIFYASTGMEQMLYILLIVLCTEAFYRPTKTELRPQFYLALLFSAAAWLRPETPFIMVIGAIQCWLIEKNILLAIKRFSPMACYFTLGYLSLLIIRWVLFNDVLPNTYYAKEPIISSGISYIYYALIEQYFFSALLFLASLGAFFGTAFHRQMLISGLLWLIPPVIEGGDWMLSLRFLMPSMTFFLLASSGISAIAVKKSGAVVIFCIGVFSVISHFENIYLGKIASDSIYTTNFEQAYRINFVKRIDAESVGLVDIGLMGYLTDVKIFDIAGLTDSVIARSAGSLLSKEFDLDYLFKRQPDIVFLRAFEILNNGNSVKFNMAEVERRIMVSERFHTEYELLLVTAPSYETKFFQAVLIFNHKDFPIDQIIMDSLSVEEVGNLPMLYFKQ